MTAQPIKSVHTGQYLIEVWTGEPGDTKYPRRLTVKVRLTTGGPFILQRVRKFFTAEACDVAFAEYAKAAVPTLTPTPTRKRGKR